MYTSYNRKRLLAVVSSIPNTIFPDTIHKKENIFEECFALHKMENILSSYSEKIEF